jgi:hypothetical protein
MERENRVLCRNGARELTEQEADHISGGCIPLHSAPPVRVAKRTEMRPLASAAVNSINFARSTLGNSFDRAWASFNGPN